MIDFKAISSEQVSKFEEILALYTKVKSIIIQAEQETGKAIIACINEQRNSYDHFLRALQNESKFSYEIDKAKGHLYRAAYDAYEILAIGKLESIKILLRKYDADLLNKTYPKFIGERYQQVVNIEKLLVTAREKKTDFIGNTTNFELYEHAVNQLIEIHNEVVVFLPLISMQNKKQRNNNIMIGIGGTIGGGVILLIIEHFVLPLF